MGTATGIESSIATASDEMAGQTLTDITNLPRLPQVNPKDMNQSEKALFDSLCLEPHPKLGRKK